MDLSILGKDAIRIDAWEKVTGKAKYCSDFKMPGLLHAKVLRSPYPHAKIMKIDTARAENLPGVRAVVTGKDVPSESIGLYITDQYVLARDNIARCVGDPLVGVAADTLDIAEEALTLIDVDYQIQPAIFDPEVAMVKDPPVIIHPDFLSYKALGEVPWRPDPERPNICRTFRIRTGDVEKGFQDSDLIIENRYTTARIQHCPLESHRAVAWWESGSLTIRTSSQSFHLAKSMIARVFNLPQSKVKILAPYLGGGFGCKSYAMAEPLVALLALKTGKPVSLIFTRDEMFLFGRHRVPMIFYIKDGAKKDGTLVAREITTLMGLGAYSDVGVLMVGRTIAGATGTYRLPNLKVDSYGVYTNEPITGPFRGFGTPEIHWAIEQQMDIIGEKLGIDPVELRKMNILKEGEKDPGGQITHAIGLNPCLEKAAEWIKWSEGSKEEEKAPWKRGKGIAIGSKSTMAGTSSTVIVKVWPDGMIEVRHSGAEMGQGLNTTLAQLTAEEFGVSLDKIKLVTGDTDLCGYDFGTCSMRGLFSNGNALVLACRDAKSQLFKMAGELLEATPSDLEIKGGNIYVKGVPEKSIKIARLFNHEGVPLKGGEILGAGSYTAAFTPQDPKTGRSDRYVAYFSHGANAAEVAVNMETGEVKVLRIVGVFDSGEAVNPKIVEGQIEGGLGMGIGSALYEIVVLDNGKMINPNFVDYRIPTATALPSNEHTKSIIAEVPLKEGPYGAKGIGEEVMVPVAPAIGNAIYNAIGIRIKDLPITREVVLRAIKEMQVG